LEDFLYDYHFSSYIPLRIKYADIIVKIPTRVASYKFEFSKLLKMSILVTIMELIKPANPTKKNLKTIFIFKIFLFKIIKIYKFD